MARFRYRMFCIDEIGFAAIFLGVCIAIAVLENL